MASSRRAAASRHIDADALTSRVREAVGEALNGQSETVEVVVRIEAGHVDIRTATGGSRHLPVVPDGSFAAWFRTKLSERTLTQELFARQLGVSAKTVNRWCRGETEPRFRELVMLAETLGESPFGTDRGAAQREG